MNDIQIWAEDTINRIIEKYSCITQRTKQDFFPYTVKDNRFVPSEYENNYEWWTNGFYPGILWKLYLNTNKEEFKTLARHYEGLLDVPLYNYEGLHHDVGFMWLTTAVADYKITGNEPSKKRALLASSVLASRYNIDAGFIKAWNGENQEGWAIIDSMMNLPLLYFVGSHSIAKKHADKVLQHFIRDDGSVCHIVSFDVNDGHKIEELAGQGYGAGSAWARGNAWAIYGFILSYIHTKDNKYLMASKSTAHFFLSNLMSENDFIPPCDFRFPKIPIYKDTTAAAIAACGLIELSRAVPVPEQSLYMDGAIKILKSIEKNYCNWDNGNDCLVEMGSERYGTGTNMPIIYGDYFFLEALMKLKGNDLLFW